MDTPYNPTALDVPTVQVLVAGVEATVPELLVDCFEYVLAHGLAEGLFRVNGSVKRTRLVTADYPSYKQWLAAQQPSCNDVSSVIKKYSRDYFAATGGLFPQPVLKALHSIYQTRKRSDSNVSAVLASTLSVASGPSMLVANSIALNQQTLLDSLATLLVAKNDPRKNAVFLYYLSVLHRVAQHEDHTRMSSANLAILFQPYIFDTPSMYDLLAYQGMLAYLIQNSDALAEKYAHHLQRLGPIDTRDSAFFPPSPVTSPLTDYLLPQASPPRLSISSGPDLRHRFSLTLKMVSLWDTYNSPARPKRFLLFLRGRDTSTDQLPVASPQFGFAAADSCDSLPHTVLSHSSGGLDTTALDTALNSPHEVSTDVSADTASEPHTGQAVLMCNLTTSHILIPDACQSVKTPPDPLVSPLTPLSGDEPFQNSGSVVDFFSIKKPEPVVHAAATEKELGPPKINFFTRRFSFRSKKQ